MDLPSWQDVKATTSLPVCVCCQAEMSPYRINFDRAVFLCPDHCSLPTIIQVELAVPRTTTRLILAAARATQVTLSRKRKREDSLKKSTPELLSTEAPFPIAAEEVEDDWLWEEASKVNQASSLNGTSPAPEDDWMQAILFEDLDESDPEGTQGIEDCSAWASTVDTEETDPAGR